MWWEACELAALVLPSSATAERVFSLSKFMFNDLQNGGLSDWIRLSLLLSYNRKN